MKDIMADFSGIKYTDNGRAVGMPMGGVGAGTIEITSKGTLAEFRNINNWAVSLKENPGTGLYFTYHAAGQTQVFPLDQQRVWFEGNFPFAKLTFPDLPVKLTLWCWSPFILHDLRHSSYPAAIFDAEIENTGAEAIDAGLVLSYGADYSDWLTRVITSQMQAAKPSEYYNWRDFYLNYRDEGVKVAVTSSAQSLNNEHITGINFTTQAKVDCTAYLAELHAVETELRQAYLRSYSYTPLDITAVVNNDYTGLALPNNYGVGNYSLSAIKPGPRQIYDIPFAVIDAAATPGKSMLFVGTQGKTASMSIPINRRTDCIYLLGNTAALPVTPPDQDEESEASRCWASAAPIVNGSASYTVCYVDGTRREVPLELGSNLTDWRGGLARRCIGHATDIGPEDLSRTDDLRPTCHLNVFAIVTDPSKEITALELQASGDLSVMLFAVTLGTLLDTQLECDLQTKRERNIQRALGTPEASRLAANTDAQYALCARKALGGQVFTYACADRDSLLHALEIGNSISEEITSIYTVEQRLSLAPGASGQVGLVCSWFAPHHTDINGHRFGHKYEDWFTDAAAVGEEVAKDHATLLQKTKAHYDLIATSTLPKWYREMVQSNFYLLPACTWLTQDGLAFTYESPDGCAVFGTMDVRYYGSFPKLAAFPELDATVLHQYAQVQCPDGYIIHHLGASAGLNDTYEFPTADNLSNQSPDKAAKGVWINLPIKFCLESVRHYWWTADKDFLRSIWPNIKRVVAYVLAQDDDGDGLPETNYAYDGWRMIGKSNYDANQWLVALKALARCARDLGEMAYADELDVLHQKALAAIEKHLWTGQYFRQSVREGGINDDMVSIIAMAGDWYADILGIDDGLARDRIKSSLALAHEILHRPCKYGLALAMTPDGKKRETCGGCDTACGWQYPFASHCMFEGLDKIALDLAREAWLLYTVEKARLPWMQEECMIPCSDGGVPYYLTRDVRMGSALVMSYAALGLSMDVPAGAVRIYPAAWIWQDKQFTLPVIMPKWLGQVKYARQDNAEIYELTSVDAVLALQSLTLRTDLQGMVNITVKGRVFSCQVDDDGTVEVGPIYLDSNPLCIIFRYK
jgi:uncharacterized protein (DUF608 family)